MLEKRTWVYVQRPVKYGIAPHKCGHKNPEWSEYKEHLWCPVCETDFIPEHWGVFDGPVGVHMCALLGICFDRFNLETQQVESFLKGEGLQRLK